jgi:AcrR family transcriptional regulator
MCRKVCHNCDRVSTRAPYIPASEAKRRILEAARKLLLEGRPFAALGVSAVMTEAGLARTVFYRYFDDLPAMAADLLPDSEDPLIDRIEQVEAERPQEVVREMIAGLVATYAAHGPLLRAIDDAARHDAAVAARLETALIGPRRLIARLLRGAKHPPPDVEAAVAVLMATHRAYLLDVFGSGKPRRGAEKRARAALTTLWERLLD